MSDAATAIPVSEEETETTTSTTASNENDPKEVGGVAGQRLVSFIERIERLEEEKAALMEDIKEVYAEAKGVGFDVKAMRKLVSLRKIDAEKRQEQEAILDLYKSAIGMR
ncbi:MAG: DUF2312 domain-containing protein [Alphaproteobacteria bacterium]|nr:DUF2312 domain-containing protein [Alphaproteobacteria bacterium]